MPVNNLKNEILKVKQLDYKGKRLNVWDTSFLKNEKLQKKVIREPSR